MALSSAFVTGSFPHAKKAKNSRLQTTRISATTRRRTALVAPIVGGILEVRMFHRIV